MHGPVKVRLRRGEGGGGLAIDAGTASVRICTGAMLVDEPAVLARQGSEQEPAVGAAALRMVDRDPTGARPIWPIAGGAVNDVRACEDLLRPLLDRLPRRVSLAGKTVVAAPATATGLEQRALEQAVRGAGAVGPVTFIEAPMAAAIGAGLRVEAASGSMIVDIGHGVTEAAITSLGGLAAVRSVRVGGACIRASLTRHLRDRHGLAVGDTHPENLDFAPAGPTHRRTVEVQGRDTETDMQRRVLLSVSELTASIEKPLRAIVTTIRDALDAAPEALAADVIDEGITLVGGGSLVVGVPEFVAAATGLPVRVPPRARLAVIDGTSACLEHARILRGYDRVVPWWDGRR